MAFTMGNNAAGAIGQVAWQDSFGNPALVDGATAWASSDTTLATVTVDATDSTKVTVVPAGTGNLGNVQVTATVDADIGAGVQQITALGDITIIAGTAVAGTITFTAAT